MASIASLNASRRGEDRTGTFRGAGAADASAWRTVRRCTPCRFANARIDNSSTRASRRIAANNSTLDSIPTPIPRTIRWNKAQVGPDQTVITTPASRTWGQIRPSQRGQINLSQPAPLDPSKEEPSSKSTRMGPTSRFETSA